jgi:hypothetical protein
MGFWGYFIVARSEHSLADLGAISALCSRDGSDRAGEVWGRWSDGSWQFLQVHRGDPSAVEWLAGRLSAETDAPALAIYVLDSDCGVIVAASPRSGGWRGYLAPDIAIAGYGMPPSDASVEQIAEAAAGWAAEAGRRAAAADAIAAAMAESPGPFGEGVDELMSALGFHFE